MGLSWPLESVSESECSDAKRNEKVLRAELQRVERGEALGRRGALMSFEAAR